MWAPTGVSSVATLKPLARVVNSVFAGADETAEAGISTPGRGSVRGTVTRSPLLNRDARSPRFDAAATAGAAAATAEELKPLRPPATSELAMTATLPCKPSQRWASHAMRSEPRCSVRVRRIWQARDIAAGRLAAGRPCACFLGCQPRRSSKYPNCAQVNVCLQHRRPTGQDASLERLPRTVGPQGAGTERSNMPVDGAAAAPGTCIAGSRRPLGAVMGRSASNQAQRGSQRTCTRRSPKGSGSLC